MQESKIKIKEEKRQFTRLKSELMLKCRLAKEAGAQEAIASTRDISSTGIFFESKQAYPLNTTLEIELNIPPLAQKVKAMVRVCRVEELFKKGTYGIGAIFVEFEQGDKEKIIEYIKRVDIAILLREAIKQEASDLHLSVGHPPYLRINGQLKPMAAETLKQEDLEAMIFNMLSERQRKLFEKELELDIAYSVPTIGRVRVNIHMQQGLTEAAIRIIPLKIRTPEELGLPPIARKLAAQRSGLVLVTGPSCCGKSTTMAAMVDILNEERKAVIVSIEDPIEYIFEIKKSIIKQREVNYDTHSFHSALKHIFRQNPDVVFIGELRDPESIATAISAAEGGYFILATLHSIDTMHAINRMIEVFPSEQQAQIKVSLSECLKGIIAQKLLPRKDGQGLVLAAEVMLATPAICNVIKAGNIEQIPSLIQISKKLQMQTMDSSVRELYNQGIIDKQTAQENTTAALQ